MKLRYVTESNIRRSAEKWFNGWLQQEAQLMLTTGTTRLAVSRGQQTWYHFGSVATFRSACDRHHTSPPRPSSRCKQRYGQPQHSAVHLNKFRPSAHLRSVAANCDRILEFFRIIARYFHETRGSLNFLNVHSCSRNLPLISYCMYA